MDAFAIQTETVDDQIIIIRPGRMLDNSNAHEMVNVITEAQNTGYKFVVMDLAGLEFLSSAGVGSILGTIENSREKGGDIVLCNVPSTIRHVFKVLDLLEYLTIKKGMNLNELKLAGKN
jgi:stage II sporulation protein AA (anti-sigma F factor antagonist)